MLNESHTGDRARAFTLTFHRFGAVLFFVALASAACLMPAQSDTWWQLRAGQEMLRGGSILLHDSFSHTVDGGYWPNHEWLSQVVFYGVFHVGGIRGLTAFAAALVTATWMIVWRMTPGGVTTRLLLSALAIGPFATEWTLRPQIFTLALLAVTVWLLERGRYLFLPPLFVIWANLHGGVMLGGIVVASHAVAAVVVERRVLIRPVVAGAVCALMTGVTPLGFSLWTEVPESLRRLREYQVLEWRPPSVTDPFLAPFWLLAAVFVVLFFTKKPWHGKTARQMVMLWGAVALLPVALNASRNVPYLLLVLVPPLGGLLEPFAARFEHARRRERPAFNAAVLSIAAAAAAAAVGIAWSMEIPKLQWRPLSAGAISAVESCPDSIYNRYDEGGYLIWFVPARKVFIDSRQDPYPVELVREHLTVETSGSYEEMFDRYSIRCAFLPTESLLAQRLTSDRWTRVYRDATWIVLSRPEPTRSPEPPVRSRQTT